MRRRRLSALVSVVLLGLLAAGCSDSGIGEEATESSASEEAATEDEAQLPEPDCEGRPDTVTVDHFSGTDEVPVDPETVVVMDLGVLVTLDTLGIEADGFGSLGTPVPSEHQALVDAPEDVGTAWEPDYEAINALEPDLIIVATRSSPTYADMSEIAPTVDLTPDVFDDPIPAFRAVHESLGEIFCVEDRVDEAMAEIDAGIEALAAQTADAGDALVVMTAGTEVTAFGEGSRFGLVHDVYGYGAADPSLGVETAHGEPVSFEYINEVAPDVLFVVDRSAATGEEGEAAEEILDNELVRETPAWQDDRVVYVDPFAWYLVQNSVPGVLRTEADIASSLP